VRVGTRKKDDEAEQATARGRRESQSQEGREKTGAGTDKGKHMHAKHVKKSAEFDTGPQCTGSRQIAEALCEQAAHTWPNPPKLIPSNVAGPCSRCKAPPIHRGVPPSRILQWRNVGFPVDSSLHKQQTCALAHTHNDRHIPTI